MQNINKVGNYTSGGEYQGFDKAIDMYDLNYNYIKSFDSMTEYCEINKVDISVAASISAVCRRVRNYYKDFIFRFKGDIITKEDKVRLQKSLNKKTYRHFYLLTLDGDVYKEYNCIMDAERDGFATAINRYLAHKQRKSEGHVNMIYKEII